MAIVKYFSNVYDNNLCELDTLLARDIILAQHTAIRFGRVIIRLSGTTGTLQNDVQKENKPNDNKSNSTEPSKEQPRAEREVKEPDKNSGDNEGTSIKEPNTDGNNTIGVGKRIDVFIATK
jgi:hypothetical protein